MSNFISESYFDLQDKNSIFLIHQRFHKDILSARENKSEGLGYVLNLLERQKRLTLVSPKEKDSPIQTSWIRDPFFQHSTLYFKSPRELLNLGEKINDIKTSYKGSVHPLKFLKRFLLQNSLLTEETTLFCNKVDECYALKKELNTLKRTYSLKCGVSFGELSNPENKQIKALISDKSVALENKLSDLYDEVEQYFNRNLHYSSPGSSLSIFSSAVTKSKKLSDAHSGCLSDEEAYIKKSLIKQVVPFEKRMLSLDLKTSGIMPEGGNIFILKNKKGNTLVLIGTSHIDASLARRAIIQSPTLSAAEQESYIKKETAHLLEEMANELGISTRSIIPIPSIDFHLDFTINYLGDSVVGINSPRKVVDLISNEIIVLEHSIQNLKNGSFSSKEKRNLEIELFGLIEEMEGLKNENKLSMQFTQSRYSQIKEILLANHFDIVPLPGNLYDDGKILLSFINGCLFKDRSKFVFFTGSYANGSVDVVNALAASMQKEIKQSLKKRGISIFFEGDSDRNLSNTYKFKGGLHCATNSITLR